MPSPDGVGRAPWKPIGVLLLLFFSVLLVLYLFSVRANRNLKRRITGLTGENEALQESLDAGNTELDALKQSAQTTTDPEPA
jgi:Flp pilus assembly protein TadB